MSSGTSVPGSEFQGLFGGLRRTTDSIWASVSSSLKLRRVMGSVSQCCDRKISYYCHVLLRTVSIPLMIYLIFFCKHVLGVWEDEIRQ